MITKSIFLLITLSSALSSPLPTTKNADTPNKRILYDQRQEGEWNVHADLQNFVILVIPTQTSTSSTPVVSSLLDYVLKAVPKRAHLKRLHNHLKKEETVPGEETMHFIESKTAPYHVDISRSKNHLAHLHPDPVQVINAQEIVVAKSPTIALIKDENQHLRTARAFVLTVPPEEAKNEDKKKKEVKKKNKETPKSMLKLLGAEYEQCGPGLARDSEGICRVISQD